MPSLRPIRRPRLGRPVERNIAQFIDDDQVTASDVVLQASDLTLLARFEVSIGQGRSGEELGLVP